MLCQFPRLRSDPIKWLVFTTWMLDDGVSRGCGWVRVVKMGKLETRLMIDSDLGTLGFDRTNLERETKEIEKINGA